MEPTSDAGSSLSWSAPITPRHKRTSVWYIVAGVIVTACVAYGVYSGSWPFSVVAMLIGLMYLLLKKHAPSDVLCTITEKGMEIGKRYCTWESAKGFWFLETPSYTELHVVPSEKRLEMIIQTGNQDIPALKNLLRNFAPELTERRERMIDTIIRICKL